MANEGCMDHIKGRPDNNLEVRFFNFLEAPDSPTLNEEEVNPLVPLGPQEEGELS